MKRPILIAITTIIAIAALNMVAITSFAYAQNNNISYAQTEKQRYSGFLNDIINYKAPWLIIAKRKAADPYLGYDLEGNGIFCTQFVYDCLEEAGFDFSDAEGEPRTCLGDQQRALLKLGFVKRKITNFDNIPAGSVIYAYTNKGKGWAKHVEFYLGTYDINNLDEYGNPVWSASGNPLTIGARITDRDPAPGDQLQPAPNSWYYGEVGAFDRYSRGKHYWTYAYIPSWLA